jgi:hypothetical protein
MHHDSHREDKSFTAIPYRELKPPVLPQVNVSLGRVVVWLSSPAAKSAQAIPCSHSTACKEATSKKHRLREGSGNTQRRLVAIG